jgi:hypothetical protein
VSPSWTIQYVQPENHDGSLPSVVSFNNQNSFIVVYRACWAVVHMGQLVPNIFGAAMEILRELPPRPADYPPYKDFLVASRLRILPSEEKTDEIVSPGDPAAARGLQ